MLDQARPVKFNNKRPPNFSGQQLGWLVTGLAGLLLWAALCFNQPRLHFEYSADQLSGKPENAQLSGFYQAQQDGLGNRYVWTRDLASLQFDFYAERPFALSFELRSAAVAGGKPDPVRLSINGQEVTRFTPDPGQPQFQTFKTSVTPSNNPSGYFEVVLSAETFQPSGDPRTLGTMVKSITLDKQVAWDTGLGKWYKLRWLLVLPGVGLLLLGWFNRRKFLGGYGLVGVSTTGLGLSLGWLLLLMRYGKIDSGLYSRGLPATVTLMGLYGLATLAAWPGLAARTRLTLAKPDRAGLSRSGRRFLTNLKIGLLYGLIALGLLSPVASSTTVIPNIHDIPPQLGFIVQARMALDEGQFPLRVAPWEYSGWRYPGFQFYGQLPHTLGGLAYKYLTPDNFYLAYLLLIWAALTLGAFYTYRTCHWLVHSEPAALLSGAIYMSAPYVLINIHARGAFTESIAQGLLPVVIYYSLRCYARPKPRQLLLSGLAWFGLAATHTITFLYSTIFVALLVIGVGLAQWGWFTSRRVWRRSLAVGAGYGLGWLLALYYLAPVVLEQKTLYINQLLWSPYNFSYLTTLPALLSPVSMPPGPTEGRLDVPGLHPAVGWLLLGAWLTVVYYYRASHWTASLYRARRFALPLLGLFVLGFFLSWSPFDFWSALPEPLRIAQFSYRLLTQVVWTGALLSAYALRLLFRQGLDRRHVVLGLVAIGLASSSYLQPPQPQPSPHTLESIARAPSATTTDIDYVFVPKTPEKLYGNQELPLPDNQSRLLTAGSFGALPVWSGGPDPKLVLEGDVLADNQAKTLTISLNEQKLDEVTLKPGLFSWQTSLQQITPTGSSFKLKFSADSPKLSLQVKRLTITGLSPENSLMPVAVTQKNTQVQNGTNSTLVAVPEGSLRLVELPDLYYSDMLKVTLDGQLVTNFEPVRHRNLALVGLRLPPGLHRINVSFTGLTWANWLSGLAWLVVIAGLILSLLRRGFLRPLKR